MPQGEYFNALRQSFPYPTMLENGLDKRKCVDF
jgi:hypothetical protein